jgi:hypothetical protein
MVVRMSMAGLGRPQDIWHWTFRHFRAIQREYLKVVAPRPEKTDDEVDQFQQNKCEHG